jgi:hypothetical protein
MNASYQVSVYLAKGFHRRLCIRDPPIRSKVVIILDIEENKKKKIDAQ